MRSIPRQLTAIVAGLGCVLSVAAASAQSTRTVEITQLDQGTVWDGIIDGFPMLASKDGTGDLPGNALSVAHKNDVTEMRSVMEFPLAKLAGVVAEDIVSATLTFNVDDVLDTFGPGTEFNGQAASVIFVHPYDGDGAAQLSDFKNRNENSWSVATGGAITDTTLNTSGAIVYEVDVRDRLRAAVGSGTAFLGFLWRTNDSPTGTSIDDLGEGSAGPPGARNSRMPFLTIEVEEPPPPPNCGNGQPNAGETCDDGNNDDGDCCNRNCQLEPEGTTCSDGDACTEGDVCNATGVCQTGAAKNCDDGEYCTTDSCDPATGCVNLVANEGLPCDDQNVCTTDDVCGGGACRGVPAPVGGCDDGDACTVGDTCTDGVCSGEALCGNGEIDLPGNECDEQCDDGNTVSIDGCSEVCTIDALVGNEKLMAKNPAKAQKSTKECLVQVALGLPILDGNGIAPVQRCADNAPCDINPAENVCGFELATCLGQADPRLPACAAAAASALRVMKPGKKDVNRAVIETALAGAAFPGCTAPVRIDVELKGADDPRALLRPGKAMIAVKTKVAGVGSDVDKVKFICDLPAS